MKKAKIGVALLAAFCILGGMSHLHKITKYLIELERTNSDAPALYYAGTLYGIARFYKLYDAAVFDTKAEAQQAASRLKQTVSVVSSRDYFLPA